MLFSKKKHALNFILLKLIAIFFLLLYVVFIFFLFTFIHFRKIRSIFFVVFCIKKGFFTFFLLFLYKSSRMVVVEKNTENKFLLQFCCCCCALLIVVVFGDFQGFVFFLFLGLFGSVWRAPKRALTLNSQLVQQKAKFILKIHTRKIVNERTAQRAYNQMQPTSNIERTK